MLRRSSGFQQIAVADTDAAELGEGCLVHREQAERFYWELSSEIDPHEWDGVQRILALVPIHFASGAFVTTRRRSAMQNSPVEEK